MPNEIWSFIEAENGKLHDTAAKMATEAKRNTKLIKGAVPCGLFIGSASMEASLKDLKTYGLEKIYFIKNEDAVSGEVVADNIARLVGNIGPELVLFAATPTGGDLAARIGTSLKKGVLAGCVELEKKKGKLVGRKAIYEGKAHATYEWCGEAPYIATINPPSLEATPADKPNDMEVIEENFIESVPAARLTKRWQVPIDELDIKEARLVIGIGNAIKSEEIVQKIKKLSDLLEGVVGGTRPAVFNGLVPAENQIGSTGNFIEADVYIPIGISGSNRHTSGIRDVKNVIPINTHKEAPIFKFSELGIVNDLNEVVPELLTHIEQDTGE